jgi:type I restriction enzyme M protein
MEAAAQLTQGHDPAELTRRIWAAANLMRAGGFSTIDTIEHLSLLLFLRLVAGQHGFVDLETASGSLDPLRECERSKAPAQHFKDEVFPSLQKAISRLEPTHPARAVIDGFEPAIEDDALFTSLVELVSELPLGLPDINALIYESLIAPLAEAGHLGQYFTPRHVVDLMVSLVSPEGGETIYDPAAGTGGFLLGAMAGLDNEPGAPAHLRGREISRTVRRLCVMNLILRGIDASGVVGGDALGAPDPPAESCDVVLTNPPFGGKVDRVGQAAAYPVAINTTEGMFLQHVLAALRPGGRAAVVLPEGLLSNVGADRDLRRHLMSRARLDAVVSLPAGVFKPYTAVKTGVMVFTKGEPTRQTWFFDMGANGAGQGARRTPGNSDLAKAERAFRSAAETQASTTVSRVTIEEHDERLVASRYLLEARNGSTDSWIPLGDICRLRRQAIRPIERPNDHFAYVALEHIEAKTGRLLSLEETAGAEIRSAKSRFQSGDVLYGKLRPYLAKVLLADFEGICSTELLVVVPDGETIRADFLAEMMRSPRFTESAMAMTAGANHPRVHPDDLLQIKVPVPTLEEQGALMKRVNEAHLRIERAEDEKTAAHSAIGEAISSVWVDS